VTRLEAERVERAGEELDDVEKTDWRGVARRPRRLGRRTTLRGPTPARVVWLPTGLVGGTEARGGGGTAVVSGASCDRAGAEVSSGRGDDGGRVGGGNDLGGGLREGAVKGLRPGRRIVGLGVIGVLCSSDGGD
jgi:hypothetical protein